MVQDSSPTPELVAEKHTFHPTGAWSPGVPRLCPLLGGLALVYHVGLGVARPGGDAIQGLNEVVLVGELEHTFLGKKHQGHTGRTSTQLPSATPRGLSCPAEPPHQLPPDTLCFPPFRPLLALYPLAGILFPRVLSIDSLSFRSQFCHYLRERPFHLSGIK